MSPDKQIDQFVKDKNHGLVKVKNGWQLTYNGALLPQCFTTKLLAAVYLGSTK